LKRIAPIGAPDAVSSITQAQPIASSCSFIIQRIKSSTNGSSGASGVFENRVTSGIDRIAPNAAVSPAVGARSRSRLVVSDGNFEPAAATTVRTDNRA
jgi:hypothetical protein